MYKAKKIIIQNISRLVGILKLENECFSGKKSYELPFLIAKKHKKVVVNL